MILVKNMLFSKLHCQKGSNSLFIYMEQAGGAGHKMARVIDGAAVNSPHPKHPKHQESSWASPVLRSIPEVACIKCAPTVGCTQEPWTCGRTHRHLKDTRLSQVWPGCIAFCSHGTRVIDGAAVNPNTPNTLHPTPYTLHPTPDTLHLTTHTLHPTSYTLHPTPYTLHPPASALHPTPYTLHPTPYTLHPTPYTLCPTPYNLHPTPFTLHPASYTLHPNSETRNHYSGTRNLEPGTRNT